MHKYADYTREELLQKIDELESEKQDRLKGVERELFEKETIFESIARHSQIGVFTWNPYTKDGYATEKWCSNMGMEYDEDIERLLKNSGFKIHPDDLSNITQVSDELREGKREFMDVECRILAKDKITWIRYIALIKTFNLKKRDVQIIGLNIDITSLKEKELESYRNFIKLESVLRVHPDAMFIMDKGLYIKDVLSTEDKLYHEKSALKGHFMNEYLTKDVTQVLVDKIAKCLEEGSLQEMDYIFYAPEKHYMQARIVPFEDEDVLVLVHNIDERMRQTLELEDAKRKAEDADRMKSTFMANMSHEIRTPLNAIVGFSEILTMADNQEERNSYLEIIKTNSDLLLQLINDILDLSRIESGKIGITRETVNINEVLSEIYSVHQIKMKSELALKLTIPEEKCYADTDKIRFSQVINNFLSNAIKNTESGCITIALEMDNETIKTSVIDTGCGIPKDQIAAIFGRFTKLNDYVQGTGLGLAICQTIAERLKGSIEVDSELGEGSVFSFIIPRKKGASVNLLSR